MTNNENRPESARLNRDRKTVNLGFPGGTTREFYLRGGICWPTLVPSGGVRGFALLAGYDVETRVTYVFEEHSFVSVDHVIDESGIIVSEGLSTFLNLCWTTYFARRFYWRDVHETYRKYGLQIHRSDMIGANSSMMEMDWREDTQPIHSIFLALALKTLRYASGTRVDIELKKLTAEPDMKPSPEIRALMACVAGLEKHPWKEARYGHCPY